MDKEKLTFAVLKELEKKKFELEGSAENFRKSAGEQSKSIESWSDSSRAQFNMMAGAIRNDVKVIESATVFFKNLENNHGEVVGIGSLVAIKDDGQDKFFFIVPEGAGGFVVKVDGKEVLVIASISLIGSVLVGKKTGETAVFSAPGGPFSGGNSKDFKIISIK